MRHYNLQNAIRANATLQEKDAYSTSNIFCYIISSINDWKEFSLLKQSLVYEQLCWFSLSVCGALHGETMKSETMKEKKSNAEAGVQIIWT